MANTDLELKLGTWTVPSDSRERNWGEGIVIQRCESDMQIFFRFYESNVFGAVTDTGISRADKEQTVVARSNTSGDGGVIEYPNQDMTLRMTVVNDGVELALEIANQTQRDWPKLASLDPCLNPGRDRNDAPVMKDLVDPKQRHTFYYGQEGLARIQGKTLHVNEDYYDLLEKYRSDGRIASEENLPWTWGERSQSATKPLLIRETPDRHWSTGIVWEDMLGAKGTGGWHCMHLLVKVGPVPVGESKTIAGKIYLENESADQLLERMDADFDL